MEWNILSFLCCPDYVEPLLHWLVSNQRAMLAELQLPEQTRELVEGHLALVLELVFLDDGKPFWLGMVSDDPDATKSFLIVFRKQQFRGVQLEANVVFRPAINVQHANSCQYLLVNVLVVEGYPRSDVS